MADSKSHSYKAGELGHEWDRNGTSHERHGSRLAQNAATHARKSFPSSPTWQLTFCSCEVDSGHVQLLA